MNTIPEILLECRQTEITHLLKIPTVISDDTELGEDFRLLCRLWADAECMTEKRKGGTALAKLADDIKFSTDFMACSDVEDPSIRLGIYKRLRLLPRERK